MQGGDYCGLLPCKGAINYGPVVLFGGGIAGIVFRSLVRKDEFALFFQGLNLFPLVLGMEPRASAHSR